MADKKKRQVSEHVISLAAAALADDPRITGQELHKQLGGYGLSTAKNALAEARERAVQSSAILADKALELAERRQGEALRALALQLDTLENDSAMLDALTASTFQLDESGRIAGIIPQIKGYNREGDAIYESAAKIVKEYLEARGLMVEQERLITGIEAVEKAGIAKAGKTDIQIAFVPTDSLDI